MAETTWKAELCINGSPMNGIEMGKGFMDAIGGAAPKKDYVTNNNALRDGVQYCDGSGDNDYGNGDGYQPPQTDRFTPKLDERQVTLNFYIKGKTQEEFEQNKEAFFAVLYNGSVDFSIPSRRPDTYYRMKYKNGASYDENRSGTFCQFSAKFVEYNPAWRGKKRYPPQQ